MKQNIKKIKEKLKIYNEIENIIMVKRLKIMLIP